MQPELPGWTMAEVEIQMPLPYAEKDIFGIGQGDASVSGLLERTTQAASYTAKIGSNNHHMPAFEHSVPSIFALGYVPSAALQGRTQLKALAVSQEAAQEQTLSGPVRADARHAADGPMDAAQHVHAGVGHHDELLVVSVDLIATATAVATAVAPVGPILAGFGRGHRVGPGIVPDVPGEEEGEGPDVRPVGEAVDDLVGLLLGGGLHLRCRMGRCRCLRRRRGLGHDHLSAIPIATPYGSWCGIRKKNILEQEATVAGQYQRRSSRSGSSTRCAGNYGSADVLVGWWALQQLVKAEDTSFEFQGFPVSG